MSTLTIRHDYDGGTVVDGTTKNSPAHAALKAHPSWVWSRYAGAWLLRSSRHRRPKPQPIAEITAVLTSLGYHVEHAIDDALPSVAEREADLSDRIADRQDRLDDRATAMSERAEASRGKADAVFGRIPLGQPMLVDHHSYPADRRRRERAWKNLEHAHQQEDQAAELSRQAESAAHHTGARYSPVTVANRIERLEADQARFRRERDGTAHIESYTDDHGRPQQRWATRHPTPQRAAELDQALADLAEELDYWRGVYADLQVEGRASTLGPDTVAVGDWVRTPAGWLPVRRVNRKTVTVPNPIFPAPRPGRRETTGTVPWHKLTGHRTPDQIDPDLARAYQIGGGPV